MGHRVPMGPTSATHPAGGVNDRGIGWSRDRLREGRRVDDALNSGFLDGTPMRKPPTFSIDFSGERVCSSSFGTDRVSPIEKEFESKLDRFEVRRENARVNKQTDGE